MWYQVLIPGPVLVIPILIITTKCTHSPKNDSQHSDVIVTYSNHADASNDEKISEITEKSTTISNNVEDNGVLFVTEKRSTAHDEYSYTEYEKKALYDELSTEKKEKAKKQKKPKEKTKVDEEPSQEDVVFIPNERETEVIRNEHYLQNEGASLQELIGGHKTVYDTLASKDAKLVTESPGSDIVFVMGKNNENIERPEKDKKQNKWLEDRVSEKDATTSIPKLDCKNLDCNNTVASICGEKIENYQKKYRLFLNDCFFRKVNCNFKLATNRYKRVALANCMNTAAHNITHTPPPPPFLPPTPKMKPVQVNNTRRSTNSRRSMTMNILGQFCSHPCPASCPELYAPECAVSSTGRHRVFVNHCALDYNSCFFGITWRSVPLSQCVGGKKAVMRQNAGFIGWMQRVGIVDRRGRLLADGEDR